METITYRFYITDKGKGKGVKVKTTSETKAYAILKNVVPDAVVNRLAYECTTDSPTAITGS